MGCHFLLQGNLPDPGFKPESHVPQADSLPSKPPGKPKQIMKQILILQMAAIISFCGVFLFFFLFCFFFLQSFPGFLANRSGIWNFLYSVVSIIYFAQGLHITVVAPRPQGLSSKSLRGCLKLWIELTLHMFFLIHIHLH